MAAQIRAVQAQAQAQAAQAQAQQAQAAQTLVQLYASRMMSMQAGVGVNPYAASIGWPAQIAHMLPQAGVRVPGGFDPPTARPPPAGKAGRAPSKAKGSRAQSAKARGTGRTNGSSRFRGVSQHKLTGRWEASLWINKRQVYLGGFDSEAKAAHAHDLAALVAKGPKANTNMPQEDYTTDLEELRGCDLDEVVARLRRGSSAFSRGKSRYRGVSGHKAATNFRRPWEARIGSFNGRKNVFLGLFRTEEEAAQQYDRALIITKGLAAKTNFGIETYRKAVMEGPDAEMQRSAGSSEEPSESDEELDPKANGAQKNRRRSRAVPNLFGMLREVFREEEREKRDAFPASAPAVPTNLAAKSAPILIHSS